MQQQLTLPSGNSVSIPSNIAQALAEAQVHGGVAAVGRGEEPASVVQRLRSEENPDVAAKAALSVAVDYLRNQESEATVLCLCVYATKQASRFKEQDKLREALEILLEGVELAQNALSVADPRWTRSLSRDLGELVDDGIVLCAVTKSVDIVSNAASISRIFETASVVWGPGVENEIAKLTEILRNLGMLLQKGTDGRSHLSVLSEASSQLVSIKSGLMHKLATGGARAKIRVALVGDTFDAWHQVLQDEMVREATVSQSTPGSISPKDISTSALVADVRNAIETVETKLRFLIETKYRGQFGDGWIQHVQAKHRDMYEYWTHTGQKDKAAFQVYQQYQPSILEYARFGDLVELVGAQWHLFKDMLDFGLDKRNKSEFYDRMKAIERVRNPLAHHRMVPENELLRAKVFCNDILLILDRYSGQGV